jgi:hypothetical protein
MLTRIMLGNPGAVSNMWEKGYKPFITLTHKDLGFSLYSTKIMVVYPLNIGITSSPVRDSLGILCNDFDQDHRPFDANVGPQAQ